MSPSADNARALELIDELREVWSTDSQRAAEIVAALQSELRQDPLGPSWARLRGERLRREHLEREQRELEERERDAGGDAGGDAGRG